MRDAIANAIYQRDRALAAQEPRTRIGRRLGKHRYDDMNQEIAASGRLSISGWRRNRGPQIDRPRSADKPQVMRR